MTKNTLATVDRASLTTLATPEYRGMLAAIEESALEINQTTQIFQKTQSQFMDNLMTVGQCNTPFRSLRQILAEMKNARQAMAEAYFAVEKKRIEIDERKHILKTQSRQLSEFQRRMLEVEVMEREWSIEAITENVGGAIRRLANYTAQYNKIKERLPDLSEETFEKEEERYHIMKAFDQGLNAARSHGGWIDEGNQIYLTQIGINGTVGQMEVSQYLEHEQKLIESGRADELTEVTTLEWLTSMADKYNGCSRQVADWKGLDVLSDFACVGKEQCHSE